MVNKFRIHADEIVQKHDQFPVIAATDLPFPVSLFTLAHVGVHLRYAQAAVGEDKSAQLRFFTTQTASRIPSRSRISFLPGWMPWCLAWNAIRLPGTGVDTMRLKSAGGAEEWRRTIRDERSPCYPSARVLLTHNWVRNRYVSLGTWVNLLIFWNSMISHFNNGLLRHAIFSLRRKVLATTSADHRKYIATTCTRVHLRHGVILVHHDLYRGQHNIGTLYNISAPEWRWLPVVSTFEPRDAPWWTDSWK